MLLNIDRVALAKPCTRSAALSLVLPPQVGYPWCTLTSLLPTVPSHSHWVNFSERQCHTSKIKDSGVEAYATYNVNHSMTMSLRSVRVSLS